MHGGFKNWKDGFRDPKPKVLHFLRETSKWKMVLDITEVRHCMGGVVYPVFVTYILAQWKIAYCNAKNCMVPHTRP